MWMRDLDSDFIISIHFYHLLSEAGTSEGAKLGIWSWLGDMPVGWLNTPLHGAYGAQDLLAAAKDAGLETLVGSHGEPTICCPIRQLGQILDDQMLRCWIIRLKSRTSDSGNVLHL